MTATPIYLALVVECERKRHAMGISMDMMAELMGVAERSYAKLVHPDTASGRQASWDKLQKAVDVLWSEGFEVVIRKGALASNTGPGTKRLIRQSAAHFDRRTQRELMREIGKIGGAASGKVKRRKGPKWKRVARARRAAKRRWSTPKITEITGKNAVKSAML